MEQGIKFTEVWHIMWFFANTLIWYPGPNLHLLYVWQLDAAPFRENYDELYFDAKQKRDCIGAGEIFGALFFKKSALFGQYRMLP